jgi:hypothetical protein
MLVGERRDIVPIGDELRALAWLGAMMIATGTGIVITKHFHEIGPLTIAAAVAVAAFACYAFALWKQSAIRDYIALLGALLISADVGFIESQWHLLGAEWQRHFLLLAVVHAAAAYAFGNRAVLSLSIAALASWFGIEKRELFSTDVDFAWRAFACAAVLIGWRLADRRVDFHALFEHFAANIAFWGALVLTSDTSTRPIGLLVTLALAAVVMAYGLRTRRELFVMYAGIYALIAIDIEVVILIADVSDEPILAVFYVLLSTVAAIAALFAIHVRFQKERLAHA